MRSHLPFTDEEQEFRRYHLDELEIPEHHYARGGLLAGDGQTDDTAALRHGLAFARPVHGYDISSYQPAGPDFRAGGRQFAIFKATEGTGYFDRNFNANRARAHAQGLAFIGEYHFARPGSHSPEAEAKWFLDHVGPRQPGECAVLDYETSPWSVPWIVRWIQLVNAAGWPVEFYSYLGMLSANPTNGVPQTGCGLWVAAYGCREPGNDRWATKDLWQHTDGASSVCGNDGPWDCSIGDLDLLVARAGTAPGPTPPPTSQEEPVGAYALPVLEPGTSYTHRLLPTEHSGGIPFGAGYVSFGADFGDPAISPRAPVPLRVAVWDQTLNGGAGGWIVLYGGGRFDANGKWVEENPQVPPLYVDTVGGIAAIQFHKQHTKMSIAHVGKLGRVVPLVEYQAG